MLQKNKLVNITKKYLFFIAVSFAVYQIYINHNLLIDRFNSNWTIFLKLIIAHTIFHHLYSIRSLFIIRNSFSKLIRYYEWNKNYFKSILIQETIVSYTGFLYRSIYLNKIGLSIKDLVLLFYFGLSSYLFVNLSIIYFEIIFILEYEILKKLIVFFVIFSLGFIILFFPVILNISLKFFRNFLNQKYLINFFNYSSDSIRKYWDLIKNKNNLIYIFLFGIFIHVFEISLLYFSSLFFSINLEIATLVLLFAISVFSDRIPFLSSIPLINEILFGYVSTIVGFDFHEGFLIKTLLRLSSIFSLSINLIVNGLFSKKSY